MVRGSRFKEHFDYYDIHVISTQTTSSSVSQPPQPPPQLSMTNNNNNNNNNNNRSPLRQKNSNRAGMCTLKRSPHVKKRQFSRSPSVVHPMSRSPSFQQRVMSTNTATSNVAAAIYRASNTPTSATPNAAFGKNISTVSPHNRFGRTKFVDWCLKQKAKLLHHRPHHHR